MLTNVLVLLVLCVAMYFIVKKEKEQLQSWLHKDRTPMKTAMVQVLDFWGNLCKKSVRVVSLVVILVCQKSVWGMLVGAIILLGVSYYLAAHLDLLQKINWEVPDVQKTATLISSAWGLVWLLDKLELSVVYIIALIGALLVGVMAWALCFAGRDTDASKDTDIVMDAEIVKLDVVDAEVVDDEERQS